MTQRVGSNRIANNSITLQKLSNLSDPNLAFDQANAAFVRANNSLNSNAGGTVTANTVINAGLTTSNVTINTWIDFVDTNFITTPANGVLHFNTNTLYATVDNTQGPAFAAVSQYRYLEANAAYNISTAALPFMGNSKGVMLTANCAYEVEWETYFLRNTTAGTVTFAIRLGAAPQLVNAYYLGGVANTPGPANTGGITVGTVDPVTLPATPSAGVNTISAFNIKALIITNQTTSGNCYLQALTSAGTITPRIGSYMKVTKLPRGETGTFA